MSKYFFGISVCLLFLFSGCRKDDVTFSSPPPPDPSTFPVVSTVSVDMITDNTARITCSVISQGSANIISSGIEWTEEKPFSKSHTTLLPGAEGSFTVALESLPSGTWIFVRALATNSFGLGAGEVLSFKTTGKPGWRKSDDHLVNCMVSDFGRIFAGTTIGIMRSNDSGYTWERISITGINIVSMTEKTNQLFCVGNKTLWNASIVQFAMSTVPSNIRYKEPYMVCGSEKQLIFVADTGLMRSFDNGLSWEMIETGLVAPPGGTRSITTLCSGLDKIYAISREATGSGFQDRLYFINDTGGVWNPVSLPVPANTAVSSIVASGGKVLMTMDKDHILWDETNGAIKINDFPANTVLKVTGNENIQLCSDLHNFYAISRDHMKTWKVIDQSPLPDFSSDRITNCFVSRKFVWVRTDAGLFRLSID